MFTLQGFELEDITSDPPNAPRFSYSSAVATFTLIRSQILESNLHYRVQGIDDSSDVCDMSLFYNFTMLLDNGRNQLESVDTNV